MNRPDISRWMQTRPWAVPARWQAWLPLAASYLAAVLLAYMLADLTWQSIGMFYRDEPLDAGPAGAGVAGGPAGAGAPEQVAWKTFALFGAEPEGGAAAAAAARPAPPPQKPAEPVRLTLYGTIASDDPDMSLAVVAVKGAKPEIYRVHDELQQGVVLKSVDAWSVVVSAGGEDQVIRMIEVSQLPDRPVPPMPSASRNRGPATASERRISEPDVVEKLQEYREALGSNPLSLMDKLRAYPVQRGGEPYGIRVRPGTDRALLGQIGLRSGDILIALNGVPLHDVKNLPDVITQLKSQSEFSVEIERAGKRQELRVVMDGTGSIQ